MVRVVGTDPGTSSLDLLLLVDGVVVDQARLSPELLRDDPGSLVAAAEPLGADRPGRGALGIRSAAGPRRRASRSDHLEQMSLVRPDERGRDVGVIGFRAWVRAFARARACRSSSCRAGSTCPRFPPTARLNAIDMGTRRQGRRRGAGALGRSSRLGRRSIGRPSRSSRSGSAFSAILVVERGRLVDAAGGHPRADRPAVGGRLGRRGRLLARRRSRRSDLFRGGLVDLGPERPDAFRESLIKHVAGLQAVTPFERIYLSGPRPRTSPRSPGWRPTLSAGSARCRPLPMLPGAWVKHAAQGVGAPGRRPGRRPVRTDLVASLAARVCRFGSRYVCDYPSARRRTRCADRRREAILTS